MLTFGIISKLLCMPSKMTESTFCAANFRRNRASICITKVAGAAATVPGNLQLDNRRAFLFFLASAIPEERGFGVAAKADSGVLVAERAQIWQDQDELHKNAQKRNLSAVNSAF